LRDAKLSQIAFTNIKQSARFSSCLTVILILIISVITLVVKWSLLQPIHNEIMNKYKTGQLLFYNRISFCDLIDLQDFNIITVPIASLIILIFIIFSKRTSYMTEKFNGYFAPVMPLDFYINIQRQFFAVVFAAIADELLDIVNQTINGDTPQNQGLSLFLYFKF
jgi:hypothetical protein